MNKANVIYGFLMGFVFTFVGMYLYIEFVSPQPFNMATLSGLNNTKSLGKVIALGATLNLLVFSALLKYDKIQMARGLILSVITTAIALLFI